MIQGSRHTAETRQRISASLRGNRNALRPRKPRRRPDLAARNRQRQGGRIVTGYGYVKVWVGPNKYEFEHRLVMERVLGRPLTRHEVVHHVNGIRADNRPENLQLFPSRSAHQKHHELRRKSA